MHFRPLQYTSGLPGCRLAQRLPMPPPATISGLSAVSSISMALSTCLREAVGWYTAIAAFIFAIDLSFDC